MQCHSEYLHASILCHIQSATYWTQEFRQTSSYLHDIYRCVSSYHTTQDDIELKGERTLGRVAAQCAWTVNQQSKYN